MGNRRRAMKRGVKISAALLAAVVIPGIAVYLATGGGPLVGGAGGGGWRERNFIPGNWNRAPVTAELTAEQREEIERLQALGYVGGSEAGSGLAGVVKHVAERAYDGLNFVVSGQAPEAVLLDMQGRTLHRWRHRFQDVFPDRIAELRRADRLHHWRRAFLLPDGSVLAIFAAKGMIKIDANSELIWAQPAALHHDAHVLPSGEIYGLARRVHVLPRIDPKHAIAEDLIVVLDGATGAVRRELSIIEALERSDHRAVWDQRRNRAGDVLHTNSIKVIDERTPAFAPGQVLVSCRSLDALLVVDLDRGEVVWTHRGPYRWQHDARPLPDGRLMLFDNRSQRGRSRVLEIDPIRGGARVLFDGGADLPFHSKHSGAARRLPNGNLLIVATNTGRALEVDPEGTLVWDYHNPHRTGADNQYVASLFDVIRVDRAFVADWLGPTGAPRED